MERFMQFFTGKRGELSHKRGLAFLALVVASFGFFFHYAGYESFLAFASAMTLGSLFERK